MKIEVGKTYLVNHRRKGEFAYKVTGRSGDFLQGVVMGGNTHTILEENSRGAGEALDVRESLILWVEEVLPWGDA